MGHRKSVRSYSAYWSAAALALMVLTATASAASTPSTTTLSSSPNTAFTTAPNNIVVLTAAVAGQGATGTVSFLDGGMALTCAAGNPAPLSNGSATCSATFSSEGVHALSAIYSGDGAFNGSTGDANVYVQNHATNLGTQYCNAGAITSNGGSNLAYSNTAPYPSVIFVGDGVNTSIPNPVATVSVQLKNFQASNGSNMHMLLVAPDGVHAFDFWSGAGSSVFLGSYVLIDTASNLLAQSTLIAPGSYKPTVYGPPPDLFTPGPPTPAPQLPSTFVSAEPVGTSTFATAFAGAPSNGAWSLYIWNGTGATATVSQGWCLSITPGTGTATTTTLTSNSVQAALGQPVTFTATISATPTVNNGTVTFTENGQPLAGAPNHGVTNVINGQASITTSLLPEGDHPITASYHDSTNVFNDSHGTAAVRVDAPTAPPTLSGNTWTYCNANRITIPAGVISLNDFGPASPNPSNITVTNLPGTISSVGVTLKQLHVQSPANLETLLVGPNGFSIPTVAQTLDFFSLTGGTSPFGPQDTPFSDSGALVSATTAPNATANAPTSRGSTSYTASPFFFLPPSIQQAAPAGTFTFNTGNPNGVFLNTVPNGMWSLYFNQLTHSTGDGANQGWCMSFVENPVNVTVVLGHHGNSAGHFAQGQQGAQINVSINNLGDSNGTGSTGDPDGNHPITVVDALPPGLTPGTLPTGNPWNCTAATQTVTCVNHGAVAAGSAYPQLVIPVNVGVSAPATVTNTATANGGGGNATTSNADHIIIDQAGPVLAISKGHTGTFAQASTAVWTIQISNSAVSSSDSTDGSAVTVIDTMPAGYTLASFSGSGWTCSSATTVTCISSAVVAGGANFPPISLTVNVPPNSPTSVSNTAIVFGGGDPVHNNAGIAASSTDTVNVLQVPASITINGSATQSAATGSAFGSLAVTVKDAGGVAIPNYSPVVFTAGTGGSGQSGTFSNNTNTVNIQTNPSGIADPGVFTANTKAGSYTVGVTAGTALATFHLTNSAATTTNIVSYSVLFGSESFNLIGSTRSRLPWQITGIQVVFSQPVATGNTNSLSGVAGTGFSGLGTNTLTWTISPTPIGSFSTALLASGANALKDVNGNAINGGTNFVENFKVLWGDVNDDGVVSASDPVLVNAARSSAYNIFADANGDGVVNTTDVTVVRGRIGTSQP